MNTRGFLKRPVPSAATIAWRTEYLIQLGRRVPRRPTTTDPQGLSPGNSKTGRTGSVFKAVFVWNLPSVVTCPGASSWCLVHCYNADPRTDVFPVDLWAENWWWALNDSTRLRARILGQIAEAPKPCGVRIHSSGDFFSAEYVALWRSIVSEVRDTSFWTYTRSWREPALLPELSRLRGMPQIHIWASWDSCMPPAPPDWRRSLVGMPSDPLFAQDQARAALACPEQYGLVQNCASCAFCASDGERDVIFTMH